MRHLLLLTALLLLCAPAAVAHVGHGEAPGDAGAVLVPVIELDDAVIQNLGIATEPARLGAAGRELTLNATIEYLPELYAAVTPKANGTVSEIAVKIGDAVRKGQRLVTFLPTFVGASPVHVASPMDGFVVKQNAVMGQPLTPETRILEIADTRQLLVKGITYSATDFARIKIGQGVRVTSARGSTLAGGVQRLDVGSDKESRTLAIYALIDNPDGSLFANAPVSMAVSVEAGGEALSVPAKAVLGEMGNYFLFVRDGNRFERRALTLGRKLGDRMEILEGVLPNEAVVTVGNYQLQYARPSPPPVPAAAKD